MKKTLSFILAGILAIISVSMNAQEVKSTRDLQTPPAFFNYQAALRDASGLVLAEEEVEVVIDILEGGVTGAVVYTQTETVTTTAQGLINIQVGSGLDLDAIAWGSNSYFVKLTVNGTEMGTSELLTVPYAMYSDKAGYSGEAYYSFHADEADVATEATTAVNATYADTAEYAQNVHWEYNNVSNVLYSLNDKVGIGVSSASAQLHVGRDDAMTNSQIWVSQDGDGDACIGLDIGSGVNWSMGVDNSDEDKFKISNSFSPSTNAELITLTTDGKVGVGTNAPEANLHVQGGMKVGETGVEIGDIVELTGITSATNDYVVISWPAGWTKENTRVLSVGIQRDEFVEGYKSLGYSIDGVVGTICVSLSSSIYLYYPDDATMKGENYRITLMRVQ